MNTVTEQDVKAQMIRDKRTHRVKEIAPFSIVSVVVLEASVVGYLEKNTGGKPWVVVDPGELAIEVDKHDRLEVLVTPCELARDWMAQTDVLDASTYRDATSDLLEACKLALSDCEMAIDGLWKPNIDGFRATAHVLGAAITKFERTRK